MQFELVPKMPGLPQNGVVAPPHPRRFNENPWVDLVLGASLLGVAAIGYLLPPLLPVPREIDVLVFGIGLTLVVEYFWKERLHATIRELLASSQDTSTTVHSFAGQSEARQSASEASGFQFGALTTKVLLEHDSRGTSGPDEVLARAAAEALGVRTGFEAAMADFLQGSRAPPAHIGIDPTGGQSSSSRQGKETETAVGATGSNSDGENLQSESARSNVGPFLGFARFGKEERGMNLLVTISFLGSLLEVSHGDRVRRAFVVGAAIRALRSELERNSAPLGGPATDGFRSWLERGLKELGVDPQLITSAVGILRDSTIDSDDKVALLRLLDETFSKPWRDRPNNLYTQLVNLARSIPSGRFAEMSSKLGSIRDLG